MKIKKFPQSCIMINSNGINILVDPGTVKYDSKFLKDWNKADVVLLTHRHGDHVNAEALTQLNKPIFSTQEVKSYYSNLDIKIIKEGDKFNICEIEIEVVKAIHGFIAKAGEVNENVGFIINDGKTKLYITSDTIRFDNNYKCDVLFADITAFDASMNLFGAGQTYLESGAKLLIVAHQDAGKMFYTKAQVENYFKEQNINYIIPNIEEEFNI